MFGGAYAPNFQRYGHYVDLLAKEVFQKPVSVDKRDAAAGVKTSCEVKVRALWQMLKGKLDGFSGVGSAPESKAWP